jgi:hypothetical protein
MTHVLAAFVYFVFGTIRHPRCHGCRKRLDSTHPYLCVYCEIGAQYN